MGKAGRKQAMREIAETKAAGKDAAFEAILDRIEESGGEIQSDESFPLYTEVGTQELEIGYERIVIFSRARMDFELTRTVETHSLQGAGHQKHVEELAASRAKFKLRSKPETSQEWVVVDLDDMEGLF